ncbi:GNAT family N-acetyltransferase [Cellulomonas sp. CW35]|uniref:GNAT family N-acetyltransferase n=1 Tax=Cellulomonas sp. CW35 TaxID=3458249 RepID=UPI000A588E47
MTTVRRARLDDLAALADLAAVTFPLACPPGSTPEDQRAFVETVLSRTAFEGYLADGRRTVLVAHDEAGTLEGYTMLVAGMPADSDVRSALSLWPTAELSKCYVHPDRHGRGVADALMTATLADARGRHALGCWLGVNQLNARAQRFYERHGFLRVGTKHFRVGSRIEDDFVLERAL